MATSRGIDGVGQWECLLRQAVGGATPTVLSPVELAPDVEGLRLVLMTTVGDRYGVKVSDDGSVVGLWRISEGQRTTAPLRP